LDFTLSPKSIFPRSSGDIECGIAWQDNTVMDHYLGDVGALRAARLMHVLPAILRYGQLSLLYPQHGAR